MIVNDENIASGDRRRVVIATHTFAYGPSQAFRDFISSRAGIEIQFIEHPLPGTPLTWLRDLLQNIILSFRGKRKIDLYVGCNNLNTLSALFLKFVGRVSKVVYYSQDYSPRRFDSHILNSVYHLIDSLCVRYVDAVWNCCAPVNGLDPMIIQRENRGMSTIFRKKQIQVPDGTELRPVPPDEEIDFSQIGFVGHLKEGMGLDLLFDAFSRLREPYPYLKLLVIGSGPIEERLRARASEIGNIEMTGYLGEIETVFNSLSACGFAVAPYESNNLTPYTDPGKVKVYMSAGLPMVISKVPVIAETIANEGCGIAVAPGDSDALAQSMEMLVSDRNRLLEMRREVLRFRNECTWEKNYERALKMLGDGWNYDE